jgi:hypothetical protein
MIQEKEEGRKGGRLSLCNYKWMQHRQSRVMHILCMG